MAHKITIIEVSAKDTTVGVLMNELDQYQIGLYGLEYCYLDSADELVNCNAYMLGSFNDDSIIGIGAVKLFNDYAEIKRVYFSEQYRRHGLASELLNKLEAYVLNNKITRIYLETGYLQLAALAFYKKYGYQETKSFGHYTDNNVSVFLTKYLHD